MRNACLAPAQFAALWQHTPLSERAGAQGCLDNLCELRDEDKAGGRYVFKIGCNKYRLVAAIA